jgi:hypothetical protein
MLKVTKHFFCFTRFFKTILNKTKDNSTDRFRLVLLRINYKT